MKQSQSGPLLGYTVIELAGIGPGPYAGQLLADMGANVILVERPGSGGFTGGTPMIDRRGKTSLVLDLRQDGAADILLRLVKTADMLIEGNRPGVTERLGVGPTACLSVNPKLVYGRMTGWGQTGPWASMAGHDINYISVTGALHAMGRKGELPFPPLNLVGDYGGGSLFLTMGLLAALAKAEKTGQGDVVDAAIIDGTNSMMGIVHTMNGLGQWRKDRESNLLDGAMPYYRCYAAKDGKHVAVGCIEPQFFAIMLKFLGIDAEAFGPQNDPSFHADQHKKLARIFAKKTRDEWAEIFDGTDACVTPVLDYEEAAAHPHLKARNAFRQAGLFSHPAPAPRFASSSPDFSSEIPVKGAQTLDILRRAGFSQDEITRAASQNIIPGEML